MGDNNIIGKIVLCLDQWGEHYPTGCMIYDDGGYVIDSDWCDNADEYKEFLGRYKKEIKLHKPQIVAEINIDDIDYTNVMDCVREVKRFVESIRED